jgi:hypothetical protein
VTLVVNDPPSCGGITCIPSPMLICTNPTTLCAPPGMRGQYWLGPQNNGLNTPCNTITTPGTYTLIMTDTNGCQSSCIMQVKKYPCPF